MNNGGRNMINLKIPEEAWDDIVYNQGLYTGLLGIKTENEADRQIKKTAKAYVDLVEYLKKRKLKDRT